MSTTNSNGASNLAWTVKRKMRKQKLVKKTIIWTLAIMFTLNFIFSLLIAIMNPEAWFFGAKLEGTKAVCWLLTNGIIGIIIGFSLIQQYKYGLLTSFFFFIYNFVNAMLIPFPQPVASPFFSLGLIISFIGLTMMGDEK